MKRRLVVLLTLGALALTTGGAAPAQAHRGPAGASVDSGHLLSLAEVTRVWPAFRNGGFAAEEPAVPGVLTGCDGTTTPVPVRDSVQGIYGSDATLDVGWDVRVQVFQLRSRRDAERIIDGLRRQVDCPLGDGPDSPPVTLPMPRLGHSRAAIAQEVEAGPVDWIRTYMARKKARLVVVTVWQRQIDTDLPHEQALVRAAYDEAVRGKHRNHEHCFRHGHGHRHGHRHGHGNAHGHGHGHRR